MSGYACVLFSFATLGHEKDLVGPTKSQHLGQHEQQGRLVPARKAPALLFGWGGGGGNGYRFRLGGGTRQRWQQPRPGVGSGLTHLCRHGQSIGQTDVLIFVSGEGGDKEPKGWGEGVLAMGASGWRCPKRGQCPVCNGLQRVVLLS